MEERDIRDSERCPCSDNRQDSRIVLRISREHHSDDLRIPAKTLREQRPDRPINQPAGQGLLLGKPALTLDEAPRKLAGGVGVLTIIDCKREERSSRLRLSG